MSRKERKGGVGGGGVVGYLEGRGGADVTRGPAAAIDEVSARVEVIEGRMRVLMEALARVDQGLDEVRRLLEVSQPPMWGRVLLRWWQGDGASREPMLVRAERGPQGRMKLVRLRRPASVKLRVDRGFGLNADLAKRGVRLYQMLASRRKALVGLLGRLERQMQAMREDRVEPVLVLVGEVEAEASRMRAEAVDRLRVMGYEVDGDGVVAGPEEESGG